MKNKIILMLGHQSKVGKDTLADELVKRDGFVKIAFADKFKEVCADLFNVPLHEFYDEVLKNEVVPGLNVTRRQMLTKLSPHVFEIDPAVWVNHAIKKFGNHEKIVITDFRFPHEIDLVKAFVDENGGLVVPIKLFRKGIPEFSGSNDRSEISLLNYDWLFRIDNNGTIEELYRKAKEFIDGLS